MKTNLADIKELPVHNNTVFKKPLITQGSVYGKIATFNHARLIRGKQIEVHTHKDGEEYYLFIKGEGEMLVGDNWIKVNEGDFVKIPQGYKHSLKNNTDKNIVFISLRTIMN